MKINIEKGDLFLLNKNEYVFTHCISTDLRWGKGIVVPMMRFFHCGGNWRKPLNSVKYKIGDIGIHHILDDPEHNIKQEVCIHLFTKKNYYDKPRYEALEKALINLKNYMVDHNLTKLAMPKIGCGLDGLEWKKVSEIISNVFGDTEIEIEIRYL